MTDKDILISDLNDISEILINNGYGGWYATIREAIVLLKEQEAETGHWIIIEYDTLTCSCCGKSYYTGCDSTKEATANLEKGNVYRYCPFCGAKMESL